MDSAATLNLLILSSSTLKLFPEVRPLWESNREDLRYTSDQILPTAASQKKKKKSDHTVKNTEIAIEKALNFNASFIYLF